MNERFLHMARKLGDWVRKGEEAHCNLRGRDDAPSIASDTTTIPNAKLARTVDQQLDELDRDLDLLINVGVPDLSNKSFPRYKLRQGENPAGVPPLYEHRNQTLHAYGAKLSTPMNPVISLPSSYGIKRLHAIPEPNRNWGPSLLPGSDHTFESKDALNANKIRKIKEPDQWASTQAMLRELQQKWRHMRPPPDLEHQLRLDKPLHVNLLISSDPNAFQVNKFRASLASVEQRTDLLTTSFSNARMGAIDNKLCADIVQILRDAAPKVHHEPIFGTTGPLLEFAESIDFTLALLVSLPEWLLYTNFPDDKQVAKALGVSIQTVLFDEFWDSCVNLLCQIREASPSLDQATDTDSAGQRYVQSLLLQRVSALDTLQINRALMSAWDDLRPMVRELVSGLHKCVPGMPKFEAETEKQSVARSIPAISREDILQNLKSPKGRALSPPSLLPPPLSPTPSPLDRSEYPHNHTLPPIGAAPPLPSSERKGHLGSTGAFHNVIPTIEVPGPVSLPPVHLLFYTMSMPEDSLSQSSSPLRRELTGNAGSKGEEVTELGTPMCTIRIGEEFIMCINTRARRRASVRKWRGRLLKD